MDNPFLHNLLVFARLLRWLGIRVSPEQVSDLAVVMSTIGVERRDDVYYAARSLLVRRREDVAIFDRAFDLFFRIHGKPQQSVIDPTQSPVKRVLKPKPIEAEAAREMEQREKKTGDENDAPPEQDEAMTYSPLEVLRRKDLSQFSPEEIDLARRLIAGMEWRIGDRRTRRMRCAPRGARVDFAHLVRRNLRYGSELFYLPKRERKLKPRPLVVLADISGSMERYTRMVLHLTHVLTQQALSPRSNGSVAGVEVFVFGTRLTRITADLRRRSVDDALARVTHRVADWSGGTRIGDAIKTFNYKWARRVLHSGAVVLVISDGWDCGDLETLRDEMARLQRSTFRLMWLHPQMGKPEFEPTTLGLKVALPFVDDLLPVHNLVSLERLVAALSSMGAARPLRRQRPRAAVPERPADPSVQYMPFPQMGTSDYVRRTMTMRTTNGVVDLRYEENPDEHAGT
ncbi:MAG: VWA domain-containing protein [Chloroflexi bacterium]|nr:VWA domain-containing protein [Chloroflexota bacterium]